MVKNLFLSRCAKKIFLIATISMEIFDIVVDSMEANDYQGGISLHLSKPKTEAAIAFIVLACIGAMFSVVKVIFATYHYKVMQKQKEECNATQYQETPTNNLEIEDGGVEQNFALVNIAIKSLTLIFEDIAQAALPYWFVTRCSVDFDSIVKICFICVCPILNFAYLSFIVIRIVWNYKGKHKSKLRIILIFLLLINVIPLAFGILSSKVAFDRTHLIGDVPEIELVQRERINGSHFMSSSKTEILKKKSLYAIWQIIEGADNHCANFSLKCKNGSFFGNDIFNSCLKVRFILCYDSARLNIVYRIEICKKSRLNCHNTPLNKTGLSLKYTSDFCGENEADPVGGEVDFIQYQ